MKQSMLLALACWVAAVGGGLLEAQTQVDLRTQSKVVDFRAAPSTKPVKSGATLPATCAEAELFFLTAAPGGLNLYGCPSTNNWVLQSGSGLPGGSDTQCQFNDGGVLGGDGGCTYNKTTRALTATGGFQSGDGTKSSGIILPELSANGSNSFGIYGADSQEADGCIIVSGSPSSSGDTLFYTGTTANTSEAVPKTCKVMQWASQLVSITGSAPIDFSSLGNGQCEVQTFSLAGATAGAIVAPGYPAALEDGLLGRMSVSGTDTISVQLCNFSGATLDPAPGTFSAAIL